MVYRPLPYAKLSGSNPEAQIAIQTFQNTRRMVAIQPLTGLRITDSKTNGLLKLWKNLIGNRELGEDFHDCLLEAQLKGALQVACWAKSLHGKCLAQG